MMKIPQTAERSDLRQPASQLSGVASAEAALPRQLAQSRQIAQLQASQSKAASSSSGIAQLAKGKNARKKKKEANQKISSDRQLDPANKDLSHGLDTDFTGAKLDTSEVQGGHARDRHAAKDSNYLDGRNRKIASTFASEADQNSALEQLVAANDETIKAWIAEQYGDARLVISGEIEAVQVAARRKQKQVGVTSSGYEYPDLTVPRFVDVDTESLSHATAVLERYLIKAAKKGQTPKVSWRVITCYPHPGDEDDQ